MALYNEISDQIDGFTGAFKKNAVGDYLSQVYGVRGGTLGRVVQMMAFINREQARLTETKGGTDGADDTSEEADVESD